MNKSTPVTLTIRISQQEIDSWREELSVRKLAQGSVIESMIEQLHSGRLEAVRADDKVVYHVKEW